jgi:hypothetical protein
MLYFPLEDFEANPEGLAMALFSRAYCVDDGPFEKVVRRLENYFSVLVYLPGSCIDPAAEYIQNEIKGSSWMVYGNHPGNGKIDDLWRETGGIIQQLRNGGQVGAIYKNVDRLFLDNNGGVNTADYALMALFSVIQSARQTRILGLADLAFGRLPASVEAAFGERVWIEEIDLARFPSLIPESLVRRPAEGRERLSERQHWILGSMLRWTDPLRAYKVMISLAKNRSTWSDATRSVRTATLALGFTQLDEADEALDHHIRQSFPKTTVDPLEAAVIQPFLDVLNAPKEGDVAAYSVLLRRLPPGVILYGPPGTGKTYLSRWIARKIGLPIRVVSGADLRRSGFGDTEREIVDLFRQARRASPCVLVLDDADDLLVDRAQIQGAVAGAERAIVNTMLQQLSGFGGRLDGVLVILTTNRLMAIDEAVRSRLHLLVPVPYPLDARIVGAVVDDVARQYALDLSSGGVRDALINRFFEPMISGPNFRMNRDEAMNRGNLFSPRDIQHAMLLLPDPDARGTGSAVVGSKDVQRMIDHYTALANSPEFANRFSPSSRPS